MVEYSGNLSKLFSSISDMEQCVNDGKISLYPFKQYTKKPIYLEDEDGVNYGKQYDKQIPLENFRDNNNIAIVIGFDDNDYGVHLGALDIDGLKLYPNDDSSKWYDKEIHRIVCDDLYEVLKDIPCKSSIHARSWSGGYHIYFFTSEYVQTKDIQVLNFIKFPSDYHVEELQGKGINELSDLVEVFTKNNRRMLIYPSIIRERRERKERNGTYRIISDNPSIQDMFDNPIDDIESLLLETFVNHGFIFDEDGYNQAIAKTSIKKKRVKTYKNKGKANSIEKDSSNLYKLTPKIKKGIISELSSIHDKTTGKHNDVIIGLTTGLINLGLSSDDTLELMRTMLEDEDDLDEHLNQVEHSINNDRVDKIGFNTIITLEPRTQVNINNIKELFDKAKESNRKEVLKPIEKDIDELKRSMENVLYQYDNDSKVVKEIEKSIEKLRDSVYPFDKYYEVYHNEKRVLKRQLALEVSKDYNIKVFYDVDDKEDKLFYLTNDNYYDKLNPSILKNLIYRDHEVNYEDNILKLLINAIPRNSDKLPNLIQFSNGVFDNNTLEFRTNDEFDIKENFVYKKIGVLDESTGKTRLLTYYPNARLNEIEDDRTYTESVLRKILIPKDDEDNYNLLIDRLERDGQTILGIPRKNITINYDPKGNSGKSVINHLHSLVLNEMYVNVNAKSFDDNFNYDLFSNNHSVNIDETTYEQLQEVFEQLKQFTSPISSRNSRKMYGTDKVKAKNDGNIDIYTNHLIKITLDDGGLLGRLTIIIFPNQFRKEHELNSYDNAYLEDDKTYDKLKEDFDGLSWYVSSCINYYIDMVKVNANFRCYQTKEQVLDIIGGFDVYSMFCMIYLERDDEVETSNKQIKAMFEEYLEDTGKLVNDSDSKIRQEIGNTIKALYGNIKKDTRDGVVYPLRIKTKDEIDKESKRILVTTEDDLDDSHYDYHVNQVKRLNENQKNIYNNIKRNELTTIHELQENYRTINVNKIVLDLFELGLIRYKEQYDLSDF